MKLIVKISVAGILIVVLLCIILKNEKQHDDAIKISDKTPYSRTRSTKYEISGNSRETVRLSNLTSPPFTKIIEYSLVELAEKYHFPIEITDRKSKYLIYTDDAENVIKITKHAGHYQSVSKRNDALDELRNYGYYITHLGCNFFNLKNRDGMYIIIDSLRGSSELEDVDFGKNYDSKTEVEIIPVKIILKNPSIDLPNNIEMKGILINKKQDFINKKWQEDIKYRSLKLEDYIASYWKLLPVNLAAHHDKDPKYSKYIINYKERAGLFLPELRVTKIE